MTADLLLGPLMLGRLYATSISRNRADLAIDIIKCMYHMVAALPGNPNYRTVIVHELIELFCRLPASDADHFLRTWSTESK